MSPQIAYLSITDLKKESDMVEHFNQEDFERLKHEVETLVGRTIMSPKDFEFLTCQIQGYTNETISVSTLKRMWGICSNILQTKRI